VASFKGEYEHSLDAKGRVSFPAKLRKAVSSEAQEKFTVLKGQEQCLEIYPQDEWEKVEEKLASVNSFNREGRTVIRQFLRTAEDLVLDEQNRLALPKKLMEWAEISQRCIFIGSGNHIEVWAPHILDQADAALDSETYQTLFEKVMGGSDKA
jgi:MraZ protein